MENFEIGDIVSLKSGGPAMTVVDKGDLRGAEKDSFVKCSYFADQKTFDVYFPNAALEKSRKPASGKITFK